MSYKEPSLLVIAVMMQSRNPYDNESEKTQILICFFSRYISWANSRLLLLQQNFWKKMYSHCTYLLLKYLSLDL